MLTIKYKMRSAPAESLSPFLLLFLLISLAFSISAAADTTLVSNEPEVPVRSGQGTEYKILSLLQKGETVTSLEETDYWIKIRTATGREGWALKRYLSAPQSIDDAFSFPTDTSGYTQKTDPADEQQPDASHHEAALLPENPAPLQPEETAPSLTEQQLEAAAKERNELRDTLALVRQENEELRQNERIQWFLAGAGVLIIGWIIGLITCRSRRRKPSLL